MAASASSKKNSAAQAKEESPAPAAPGVVRMHESVVSSIVRKAVLSTKGVLRLAGSTLVSSIAEIVGSKSIQDRSIAVEMNDSSAAVEVSVIFEYGVFIPDVAKELQANIEKAVTDLTGLAVTKVNVVVMDLEDPQPEGSLA